MTEYQFYALITVILFFKMFSNSVVQALARTSSKTFVTPEDAKFFGAPGPAPDELPIVKRAAAAWRNDLENIPIFLFLAMIYVTLGCWPGGAFIYFTIFAVARILHTIVYMRGLQPWRTVFYGFGITICVILCVHILIAVL
ncbi:MAG TPA: MAPEG family protein [Candidatus Binatus sp.]|uniref:MAPEG family protein n=1 Tax=Candidatus Binatus sp. TaxID=2811406 RepID=UPI002B4691CB|nr:MAPEG family protein [Candidatus Binatus sp.]HKN11624.1 MAPEG family protein [Candidatus Binatus sp.]